jgi:hypothetical protein
MGKANLMTQATLVAIAAAMATSAQAHAETTPIAAQDAVKVGIIDTAVNRITIGSKGVDVQRRVFVSEGRTPGDWTAVIGESHGDVVASSFVQQARVMDPKARIQVFSANAFYQADGPRNGDGNRPMKLDFKGAERALEWFSENGVRTVVTAFYTSDGAEMRSFIERAKKLDIVLFAGTNNDRTKVVPFPARDPYAIAVTGTNSNLDFANNPSMIGWTAFKINGDTPSNDMLPTQENGSSFAVARAAAFGAYYVRADPKASRDVVAEAMKTAAGRQGRTGATDMNGKTPVARFRAIVAALPDATTMRLATVVRTPTPGLKAASMIASADTAMPVMTSGQGMR